MKTVLDWYYFTGVTVSERGPAQKINFEPYTDENRLHEKNHSEKIINTSPLNDSRGQEQEIQVRMDFILKSGKKVLKVLIWSVCVTIPFSIFN